MSLTLGIYWVELGFINNYKEPQLRLVLLRYSADVASTFEILKPITPFYKYNHFAYEINTHIYYCR